MFQEIRPFGTVLQEITGPDTISIVTQPTELDDFYHEVVEVSCCACISAAFACIA